MKTQTHNRGTALMTVLVLTLAMALMAGALVAYSMHERVLNRHAVLNIQAQNATRALMEYATSQISVNFPNMGKQGELLKTYIESKPFNLYKNGANGIAALYAAGDQTNNYVQPATSSFKLWCSDPTPSGAFTIQPNDPRNFNDRFNTPVNGVPEVVNAFNVYLLAQATATDPNGNSVTNNSMQVIQLRYSSIFSNSIFYNVTMEFGPGAAMTVYGPVFSNQPAYLSTGATLTFTNSFGTASTMTAAPYGAGVAGSGESGRPTGQDIYFPNSAGTEVSMSNPTISNTALGTWVDSFLNSTSGGGYDHASSTLPNESFAQAASSLWGGNVQTGMPPENLPGIPPTSAQLLIQPPNPALSPVPTASNFDPGEQEKFANQAGLYIVVTPNNNGSATGATVVAFYGSLGQVQSSVIGYLYQSGSTTTKNTAAERQAWLGTNSGKVLFSNNVVPITGGAAVSGNTTLPTAGQPGSNTLAGIVNPTRVFYDPREKKTINGVDIDVGALANAISNNTLTTGAAGGSAWNINSVSNGWNGLVYVDVETDTPGATANGWTSTSDIKTGSPATAIVGTGTETAVRLEDGGTLPTAPTGSTAPIGFSLTTNAPVYVVGTYNSDGSLTGGSGATDAQVMTPDANEVPAMVAGDAIDILSTAWWNGSKPTGDAVLTTATGTNSGSNVENANSTEIAAAFIGGNVATALGSYNYSGGVENYMRLSENWGSSILRYRGSIVALYNSSVAKGAWPGTSNTTYQAPTRQWGYDNMFGVNHEYPPGTPSLFDMRRYNYTDVPLGTYNAMLASGSYGTWTAQ
jgi:hypothetical protein